MDNLISLEEARSKQGRTKEISSLEAYFRILSFGQLINESIQTKKSLIQSTEDNRNVLRGLVLLKEINSRLKIHSGESKLSLNKMTKLLEKRADQLKLLV